MRVIGGIVLNLQNKPSTEHKLFFGEQDLKRIDLSYDPKFKQLAEVDEANVWFLNVVNCSNDRWSEFSESALKKFQLTNGLNGSPLLHKAIQQRH